MPRTIVLAYSGGLDTSIIVPWLSEHYDARVICVAADIGQGADELRGVRDEGARLGRRRVLRRGPARGVRPRLHLPDAARRRDLQPQVPARHLDGAPAHRASARSRSRARVGADALAHGCTGKGNDQVRFELTYAAFAPDLPVIAPWREWDIRSREDAIDYAAARGIPIAATKEKIYSRDRNLWHLSHEGGTSRIRTRAAEGHVHAHAPSRRRRPTTPEDVVDRLRAAARRSR